MNRDVKIVCRRLYSPSVKDVAWLERAQLIFLIFHTFVCNFFSCAAPSRLVRRFAALSQLSHAVEYQEKPLGLSKTLYYATKTTNKPTEKSR